MTDLLTGVGLDRLEECRGEEAVLGPDARVLVVRGHTALLVEGAPYTEPYGEGDTGAEPPAVLLGERDGVRYGARLVTGEEAAALEARTGGRFESLRSAVASLPPWQRGLLAFAAALLAWHRQARYCGVCGAATRSERAGHQRVCANDACAAVQFPRTDPAIITLLRRGARALLVRQAGWPPGRFSTLAGFVEPGESLEQAVAREVKEEVGLQVVRTAYFASQPWPFPHTLMVGYRTEIEAGEPTLGDELDDARWFTRPELRDDLAARRVTIPPPLSLSRSLIEDWLEDR
ncbi:MAG: NAD(+) diphosphatase [Gemmatimonadota bacterium]